MASSSASSIFGGGSLGAQSSKPQSAQTGLFGTSSIGATQSDSNPSLFGSNLQAQQQSSQPFILGQQISGDQTQPPSRTTQPAFFNSLLERGKKRPASDSAQTTGFGELPSLQLGLDDIRRKARELGAGGAKEQDGINGKA